MIPFKEVKVLDLNTEALGIPTLTLMENAGKALAEEILEFCGDDRKILILCGTGNNGGDGLVASRYLAEESDCHVTVLVLGEKMRTNISLVNYGKLPEAVSIDHIDFLIEESERVLCEEGEEKDEDAREENGDRSVTDDTVSGVGNEEDRSGTGDACPGWQEKIRRSILDSDLIVDSMLGVGITGILREPYHTAVQEINDSGKPILSVDIPTGFGGELAVRPDVTVTFHDTKEGMHGRVTHDPADTGRSRRIESTNCGKIIIRDIGIPIDAEKFVGVGDFVYYPLPGDTFHKGNNGTVLVVGGGPFTGAPALAALGALRAGSDLVGLAVPQRIYPIIASMSTDLIVHPLPTSDHITPQDVPKIIHTAFRANVVLIGPGLGKHKETVLAVQKLARDLRKPLVIDADAIYALKDVKFEGNVIMTPHMAEFTDALEDSVLEPIGPPTAVRSSRLFTSLSQDERDRLHNTMTFARTHGVTVLCKGHYDLITDGVQFKFNRTGNPGMTVGGTGDVLAGITASLLARGLSPFNSARLAAYINGYAGDLAFKRSWYSLTASDVVDAVPGVFQHVFGRSR